jgi:hypothetical protein
MPPGATEIFPYCMTRGFAVDAKTHGEVIARFMFHE